MPVPRVLWSGVEHRATNGLKEFQPGYTGQGVDVIA